MAKKNKDNSQSNYRPDIEEYFAQKAAQVRDSAANAILQQKVPDVPQVPAYKTGWNGALSWFEGACGVPDNARVKLHGYEPYPETCLYTATSQYGDKDAKVSGNITFKKNPERYGFVKIPTSEAARGDLYQFSKNSEPAHSAIYTGETEDEHIPLVSYSRGGIGHLTLTEDGEIPTMVHNETLQYPVSRIGPASAYRYVGTPSKKKEWTSEYYDKYSNPKKVYPTLPVSDFRDSEYKFPLRIHAEGGFLQPKDAWDALSMAEKSEMMKVAIKNGIYDLSTIRKKYNEFAEGGSKEEVVNTDEQYLTTMEKVAEENPLGLPGGFWVEESFVPRAWQIDTNIYEGGGYTSSDSIRKRIAKHEGAAMTGAKDPLSGKFLKNRSFESEDRSFYRALPESIRDKVLANQELADNLYSYSYNVGAGNFKKRVVPTLEKFYQGKAMIKDIEDSMWASGDSKLRGLRIRRAHEKEGVRNALSPKVPDLVVQPVSTAVFNPYIPQAENTVIAPVMVPDEDSYITAHRLTKAEEKRQKFQERMEAINNFNRLLQMTSLDNTAVPSFIPTTGNVFLDSMMGLTKAEGGSIHIKPSHRGRLTELKERTGKTEAELYNDGNPAHKKMVVFARSARKWKH